MRIAARKRALLFLFLAPLSVTAQDLRSPSVLRLSDALTRADRGAFANRGALAQAEAQGAARLAVLRGVLPTARVEAGYMRTTDPIGAFGTLLRQRAIAQDDFDPARLNYPSVAANYAGAVVIEQPLFNADALAGRHAARHATAAADASAEWTIIGTRVDVIRAYYGATLAREKVATLSEAVRAAREHVRLAEAMARNGVVTRSDALLASVKAAEVEALLIEAEGEAATAILGLATIMGNPADTVFALPSALPAAAVVRAVGTEALQVTAPLDARADLRAARAGADAAAADVARARSLYLPRLNAFARYDWHSALRPFGGDNNWSTGVMASWSPFSGASEIAEARATAARRHLANAMHEGGEARAALEVQQTARALQVALARLDLAERAVQQATEAHRIVARKYEGGLATVVELLDASAAETQTRLAEAGARYGLILTSADRRRALGLDPAALASLDASTLTSTEGR